MTLKYLVYLFVVTCVGLIAACDTEVLSEEERIKYRISEGTYEDLDGEKIKFVFDYDSDDKLLKVVLYDLNIASEPKFVVHKFSYSGENAEVLTSNAIFASWHIQKQNFTLQSGNVLDQENYYFDGHFWRKSYRVSYAYADEKVKGWEVYFFDIDLPHGNNEIIEKGEKAELIHEDGLLKQLNTYQWVRSRSWEHKNKKIFIYTDGYRTATVTSTLSNNIWRESSKSEYQFTGPFRTSTTNYYKSNDIWHESSTVTYAYNYNGYLTEENDSEDGIYTYVYEVGASNTDDLYPNVAGLIIMPSWLKRSATRQLKLPTKNSPLNLIFK